MSQAGILDIESSNPQILTQIDTNDGSAIPIGNTLNLVTDNSTVIFEASGNTVTLDFGLSNIILGNSATSLTSGAFNVGIGATVFNAITSGGGNTVLGYGAGTSITTGNNNTLLGLTSGDSITSSSDNTAIGTSSLGALATGTGRNIAIGLSALGNTTTGIELIGIGTEAGSSYTTNESSNITIGNSGVTGESHVIRLGTQGSSSGKQNQTFIAGIAGVTVSNTEIVTIDTATGQMGSQSTSSGFVNSITGTANQVLANGTSGVTQTGAVTLTTPQDIATTSNVTFNRVFGPAGTSGAPTYSFTGFTDTGVFRNNNDVILVGGGFATGAFGFNVLLSGGVTTISQGFVLGGIETQTAGFTTAYSMHLYLIDVTTGAAPITVQLINDPIAGQIYTFKDSTGAAATYNITISGTVSGKTIDGAATLVININYGVARLIYSGVQWSQI